jgi:hypothetical protein
LTRTIAEPFRVDLDGEGLGETLTPDRKRPADRQRHVGLDRLRRAS